MSRSDPQNGAGERNGDEMTDSADWQPIETAPLDALKVCSDNLLLCHSEKQWIRFGRWYVQERKWYYSGTNERSQWSQVEGDAPTHWMPIPKLP